MSKRRRLERQRRRERRERRERDAILARGCNPEVFAKMGAAWALGAYRRERGAPSVLVMAPGVAERLADAMAAARARADGGDRRGLLGEPRGAEGSPVGALGEPGGR